MPATRVSQAAVRRNGEPNPDREDEEEEKKEEEEEDEEEEEEESPIKKSK